MSITCAANHVFGEVEKSIDSQDPIYQSFSVVISLLEHIKSGCDDNIKKMAFENYCGLVDKVIAENTDAAHDTLERLQGYYEFEITILSKASKPVHHQSDKASGQKPALGHK